MLRLSLLANALRNPSLVIDRVTGAAESIERDEVMDRLWKLAQSSRYSDSPEPVDTGEVRIVCRDRLSLFMEYKDIFRNRIYDFEASRPDPRILDCGSFIGLSILFYKRRYPAARITGFEPDSNIRKTLFENLELNDINGVEIVDAALSTEAGEAAFSPDNTDGGQLSAYSPQADSASSTVKTVRLSDYLDEPVDMLKMNIEGAEVDVLKEAESKLSNVREMVIEYHNFEHRPQRLHELLALLNANGFMYLVNHFDYITNAGVKPPFKVNEETRYYLLVYARAVGRSERVE